MSETDVPTIGNKIRYQVDRFLSWSPLSRFLGLFILSFILILICGGLAVAVEAPKERNLLEGMWWAMTRVLDAGTMGDDEGTLVRMVGTLSTLCGLGVVALLIGLVSGSIGEKIEDLRKGKSPVIDENHTLILGYGEKVFTLLRELRAANANQSNASVVILSGHEKEAVETTVRERMGDMLTTRVVVRQGQTSSVHDLKKVGAGRAKSIVILSESNGGTDSSAETGFVGSSELRRRRNQKHSDAADMGVIKALLALRRIPNALKKNHSVVELVNPQRRSVVEQLGAGGVEVVTMSQTLSRMMVQTARQNGLANVYRNLLSYEGSEFYFRACPELTGQPFGEAQWKTRGAVVCGVRRAQNGAAAITINPPDEWVLEAQDELLVIAEDDDSFDFAARHAPSLPPGFVGAVATVKKPERILVCGTSDKLADILREFDNYVLAGSEAWLMPGEEQSAFEEFMGMELGSLKNLKLRYVAGIPSNPDALKQIISSDFSVSMVIAGNGDTEEADARTVMTVLLLRDFYRALGDTKPRIISEILDPRTKDLLEQDYGADFVVSSEMTSMLLAQVSERRELNAVFADLFDSNGNEVYLKRAACFVVPGRATPWLSIQLVARRRGEVAIGYAKHGAQPIINPPQTEATVLSAEDRVIVLAQDDRESVSDTKTTLTRTISVPKVPSALLPLERTPAIGRSALLPSTASSPSSEGKSVSAGPRVAGPSVLPRPPLPPKK
jgi:ion channel POLLUX/CASTOR